MKDFIQITINNDLINQSNLFFNKLGLDTKIIIILFLEECVAQQKLPFQYAIEEK